MRSSRRRCGVASCTTRGRPRPTPTRRSTRTSSAPNATNESCVLVVGTDDDALIGVYNIAEIVRGRFQNGYLGYYAFEPHAGSGMMRAAMPLVFEHAFEQLGLHRLQANVQPGNAASRRVAGGHGLARGGLRAALPAHRRRLARPRDVRHHGRRSAAAHGLGPAAGSGPREVALRALASPIGPTSIALEGTSMERGGTARART